MTRPAGRPRLWQLALKLLLVAVLDAIGLWQLHHSHWIDRLIVAVVVVATFCGGVSVRRHIINSRPYRPGGTPPRREIDDVVFAICCAIAAIVGVMLWGFEGPLLWPGIVITAVSGFLGLGCLMGVWIKQNELRKHR